MRKYKLRPYDNIRKIYDDEVIVEARSPRAAVIALAKDKILGDGSVVEVKTEDGNRVSKFGVNRYSIPMIGAFKFEQEERS